MFRARKFRTKVARRREKKRRLIVAAIWVVAVSAMLGGAVWLSHTKALQVQYVDVNGTVTQKTEIETFTRTYLEGSWLGLFPKKSIVLVPRWRLTQLVLERFPRVKTASVGVTDMQTLSVTVEERLPSALWCGDIVPPVVYEPRTEGRGRNLIPDDEWGVCYYIDSTGYIFARAPTFTGAVYHRYWGPISKSEPVRVTFLPAHEFSLLETLQEKLERLSLIPIALLIVDEEDAELYLEDGTRVLFTRDQDTENLFVTLVSILTADVLESEHEVEYIDLRFGVKSFVKYRDE